jgi:heparanase 1
LGHTVETAIRALTSVAEHTSINAVPSIRRANEEGHAIGLGQMNLHGFLAREVFDPRPNYFAVLLWNRLMGTTVYDTAEPIREGAHVFAHSRKDGKEGVVYLVINNSLTEATTVELPKSAERYTLAGEGGNVRAAVMTLNGKPLILGAGNSLPELTPAAQEAGTVTLAPATCTFFVL